MICARLLSHSEIRSEHKHATSWMGAPTTTSAGSMPRTFEIFICN